MWFKNARIFQLNDAFAHSAETLSDALDKDHIKPCGDLEMVSRGWVSPFGADHPVHAWQSGEALLIALGAEEKLLPAAVINHHLSERLQRIESEEGRKPGRKQQMDMKQQITAELLPRAFVKPATLQAWIDKRLNLIVVDTASQSKAEELISQLRQSLGSLPASAFGPSSAVAKTLTTWVTQGGGDAGFTLADEIVLETLDETKGVIRGRNIEQLQSQMQKHIDNGYLVTQLGLNYNDRVELVLGHDLGIRKIRFTDTVLDQMDALEIDDAAQLLDSRFTLMSLELRALFESLFTVFSR